MQRRDFLNRSLAVGGLAGILAAQQAPAQQGTGANEVIRIGAIGAGGRAGGNIPSICRLENVRLTAIAEVDSKRLENRAEEWRELAGGERPQTFTDYRDLIDSGLVDAVVISTPNHLHATITIAACGAGLDVYVEKPVSHNVVEGRAMVAAARQHDRIVMAGTQNRADTSIHAAKAWLAENRADMGEMLAVHNFWYNVRPLIGKTNKPTPVPATVDYNLFQGPAPLVPLGRKQLHYDWHWQWATGNGELGNVGVHVLDQARFFLDLVGWPKKLETVGGRLIGVDDGETASDQLVALDYGLDVPFTLEVAGLPDRKGSTVGRKLNRAGQGSLMSYENGSVQVNRGGSQVFHADGSVRERFPGDSGNRIYQNFIDCVRSRRREDQLADIEQGHLSTAICHYANIGQRIGESGINLDQLPQRASLLAESGQRLEDYRQHVIANEVDLSVTPIALSPLLEFEGETERCVPSETGIMANYYTSETQRAPFGI